MEPYDKIIDDFARLNLAPLEIKKLDKYPWAVTEKVHGANFSFICEEKGIQYAKRKEMLSWEDDFFGFQLMADRLYAEITALSQVILHDFKANRCVIYGELFGGEYPHLDIEGIKGIQAVQTGIYYSPQIEFYAFDIVIETDGGDRYFLDYQKMINYFDKTNLLYAKPLQICSLTEALNFDIKIQSIIPKWLNLPSLPQDNIIEGIVIKPMQEIEVETPKGKVRPLLKIKNQQFLEDDRYLQAQKWSFLPSEKVNRHQILDDIFAEMLLFVTENRLKNVISKIGHLNPENKERLDKAEEMFVLDIFDSFEENYPDFLAELTLEQKNILKKRLHFKVKQVIIAFI